MYVTWENWDVDFSSFVPIETPVTDELAPPPSFTAVVKQKLLDDGCAFCCASDVGDTELSLCTIGDQGEVLCDKCSKDTTLTSLVHATNKPLLLEHTKGAV
jgi:hypothetical protein